MSAIEVRASDDPTEVLRETRAFLSTRPVEHNVILTILLSRVAYPLPGRYWWLVEGHAVVGVGLQSPTSFSVGATPMRPALARALAAGIGPPVPGFTGEAGTAAAFAGAWAERHRCPVEPTEGQRLLRLDGAAGVAHADGMLRRAEPSDRDLLVVWLDGFAADTGHGVEPSEPTVDRYLDERGAWLWVDDHGAPVSMAHVAPEAGGVARIGPVYTPTERRGRGYATACVEHLSRRIEGDGHTAILYTQLSNPTSNAIYLRIGYEPVLEVLHYRFDPAPVSV